MAMEKSGGVDVSNGHPYKLMLSCPSGLTPSQVSVVLDKAYDRIPHPDIILEDLINQIWDHKAQSNSSLYNGTKFRYGGHLVKDGDGSQMQNCHVRLHLGLTDYRTFMGTNLYASWEKFLVQSEDETVRCQHTSNPLGNGAIVETNDGRILVLRRSNNVGEFPGHFVFPGGHPEPEEIGILSHDTLEPAVLHKKVAEEMFDSIIREVVEETGVPTESLLFVCENTRKILEQHFRLCANWYFPITVFMVVRLAMQCKPVFIGISRRELNVRPTAFFFLKCSLQSEEVQKLYGSAQDGFESTQLHTVSKDELENMAWKMPGCHHGGYALFRLMVDATKS